MNRSKTQLLAMAAMATALMAVGSFIKFPVPGLTVQFTTQVFFLLVIGLLLPPAYSSAAVGAYVIIGLLGIPVFSRGGGLQTIATAEFGYLLGFVFSAFVTGTAYRKLKRRRFSLLISAVLGILAVYVLAIPYISLLYTLYLSKPMAFGTLVSTFFLAFLPMDLLKAIAAAAISAQVRKALRMDH